ncbi:hypothetical protein DYU05_08735 [Mucilaginibacter terrenus]|uniref:DUF1579 domain-containing protein n=1 Tax=Mucilaginibacter terrenus TaxID=2482727 RepID=A0A3E2NXC1_9SPHI|nr:hypothetical protein [Mucilaginibacter terrenus]RFZ85665.1 hypothetical protein DYU05_08735 [Mucilaginibacter terrenus]
MIKRFFLVAVCSTLTYSGVVAQQASAPRQLKSDLFGWTITPPPGFNTMDAADYQKMKAKGAGAIEGTYNAKVEDHTHAIFVMRKDQMHYFEANWQPAELGGGTMAESDKAVGDILYGTFEKQMPGAKLDTSYTSEVVSGLPFRLFKMNISFPNKINLTMNLYSKVFGNKDLSVVMMYVDKTIGETMLAAFRASTFSKKVQAQPQPKRKP